jgi:hypothetical protein
LPRGKLRQHLKVINDFVEPFIDDALRLSPEELVTKSVSDVGYTFLHSLAAYTRDRKVLRDQLIAVLLAGRASPCNKPNYLLIFILLYRTLQLAHCRGYFMNSLGILR